MVRASYSVVVVTWNCADALATLVESLNEHLSSAAPQLVVVDNASEDEPFGAARGWRGPLELVELPDNRGFGAAANVGVRRADGEAVVLLNPDTWLVDSSLSALAAAGLERDAIVGPRVLNPDGSVQPSASGPVVGVWPWVRAILPGALSPSAVRSRTEPWALQRPAQVAWLTGACLAAPRRRLLELGPFDESLHLYAEDLELGLQAARAGVGSWFLPDVARIVHVGDVSSGQRYADAGAAVAAANARRVLVQAYGDRAADRALRAERVRLRLRIGAKRLLRRPTARDRAALAAVRRAYGRSSGGEPDER